jgi:hypothetical protein
MNVRNSPLNPATVLFDATRKAGMAMDLAIRTRRYDTVSYPRLAAFAQLAGIPESDLRLWLLDALERAGVFVLRRAADGTIDGADEQVGVPEGVLDQTHRVWLGFGPGPRERCAVTASDHLAYAPYLTSTIRGMLEAEGYPPGLHAEVFASLRAAGMLRSDRSERLGENVLYSPYVWGTEAVVIAEFLSGLPSSERELMAGIARGAAERPGVGAETISSSPAMISAAKKVGLVDATRVITSTGGEREFFFSPAIETQLAFGSTDVTHERKLLTAHMLYGHRYGFGPTGRIRDPQVLLRALIDRGQVGPATAIRTDYPLLEAQGIVQVVPVAGTTMAHLRLVKPDVAEDALELIELALGGAERSATADRIESLWVPGTFSSPERTRALTPEVAAGPEGEVISSAVQRLRDATARRMRNEEV